MSLPTYRLPTTAAMLRQLAALIEPATRFDLRDVRVTEAPALRVPVAAATQYDVSFETRTDEGWGALPSGVKTVRDSAALKDGVIDAMRTAYAEVDDRLEAWADRHDGDITKELDASDCLRAQQPLGYTYRCPTCAGDGSVTCGSCSGRGEVTCATCSGSGNTFCYQCSGSGDRSCGSCGGSGHHQVWRTRTYWDSSTQRNESQTYMENEQCANCSGRGKIRGGCTWCSGTGRQRCTTCGATGRTTCGRCSGSGEVDCTPCHATGTLWTRGWVRCDVTRRFSVGVSTDDDEIEARAAKFRSAGALARVAHLEGAGYAVDSAVLKRTARGVLPVSRIVVRLQDADFAFAGYGDNAEIDDYHNVIGELLSNDLDFIEHMAKATSTWWLEPRLANAVETLLASEVNDAIASPDWATRGTREFGSAVSDDYAGAVARVLRETAARAAHAGGLSSFGIAWLVATIGTIVIGLRLHTNRDVFLNLGVLVGAIIIAAFAAELAADRTIQRRLSALAWTRFRRMVRASRARRWWRLASVATALVPLGVAVAARARGLALPW